jgi:hypothetical protein
VAPGACRAYRMSCREAWPVSRSPKSHGQIGAAARAKIVHANRQVPLVGCPLGSRSAASCNVMQRERSRSILVEDAL